MLGLILMVIVGQLSMTDTLWTEETEEYQIEAHFPSLVLENEYVKETLEGIANWQIKSFKEQFMDYYSDDPFASEWAFDLRFLHKPSPVDMACIVASEWAYTGGAHGNSFTQSLNFNLSDSSLVNTIDLLGGKENFKRFASSVIDKLCEMEVDESWAERGASADVQNYHTVFPVPSDSGEITGYTVIFPPYQVACYAAGPVEVFIPVRQFQAE